MNGSITFQHDMESGICICAYRAGGCEYIGFAFQNKLKDKNYVKKTAAAIALQRAIDSPTFVFPENMYSSYNLGLIFIRVIEIVADFDKQTLLKIKSLYIPNMQEFYAIFENGGLFEVLIRVT